MNIKQPQHNYICNYKERKIEGKAAVMLLCWNYMNFLETYNFKNGRLKIQNGRTNMLMKAKNLYRQWELLCYK